MSLVRRLLRCLAPNTTKFFLTQLLWSFASTVAYSTLQSELGSMLVSYSSLQAIAFTLLAREAIAPSPCASKVGLLLSLLLCLASGGWIYHYTTIDLLWMEPLPRL